MKLIKNVFFLVLGTFMFASLASADIGFGITGTLAKVKASGTETEGTATDTSTQTASVKNVAGYGSVYLENIASNGFTIGVEYVPFAADVSDSLHERTDTSIAGSGEGVTGSNTRKASAEIENFRTLYMEIPISSAYLRLGASQIDVNTNENALTNGGTYGNATLDGYNVGLGIKGDAGGNFHYKLGVEYVDFETLSLSSSTNNSITADLDVTQFKFSVGKVF